MNIKKATNGKKTYTGVAILALTPIIALVLQNIGIADGTQVISGEVAGYIVGGIVTVIGLVHKMMKRKKK